MKTSFVVALIASALTLPGVALADGCSDGSALGGKVGYAVGVGDYTPPSGMSSDQLATAYATKQADLAGMTGDARNAYIQGFTNCWKGDYTTSFQQGYLKNPALQKAFQAQQASTARSQWWHSLPHRALASTLGAGAAVVGFVAGVAVGGWHYVVVVPVKWLYNEGSKLVSGIGSFFSSGWKSFIAWQSNERKPTDPMSGAPGFNGPINGSTSRTTVAVAPSSQPSQPGVAGSPTVVHVQGQTIPISGVGVTR